MNLTKVIKSYLSETRMLEKIKKKKMRVLVKRKTLYA